MLGAIIGDIVGSVYEFANINTKDFPLFNDDSNFTDDTVMTVAVADGLMNSIGLTEEETSAEVARSMHEYGQLYPHAGYGSMFSRWLCYADSKPYNSYGNGSAMRVSAAGWLYDDLEDTLKYAKITALPSHDHPEGIKGAQATAHAIYLARNGAEKVKIKSVIENEYGYDVSASVSDITKLVHGPEICQVTVPESIICFLHGNSYEDVIRNAISIGGDSDTIGAIAGAIAEAYYGVPENIKRKALERLDRPLMDVINRFLVEYKIKKESPPVLKVIYDYHGMADHPREELADAHSKSIAADKMMNTILFSGFEKPDAEKNAEVADSRNNIGHFESISGDNGVFYFKPGDVYISEKLYGLIDEIPGLSDELLSCMDKFTHDDFGLISEEEKEYNLEIKYMVDATFGQYGRYTTQVGIVRLKRIIGFYLFSLETERED